MSVSAFFFGVVYFRKKPVLKTFALIMVVCFVYSALGALVLFLNVRFTIHTEMSF